MSLDRLDVEPDDAMQTESWRFPPSHWYRWAVTFIQEHKAWYPGTDKASYDWLMDVAKRFGLLTAEKA